LLVVHGGPGLGSGISAGKDPCEEEEVTPHTSHLTLFTPYSSRLTPHSSPHALSLLVHRIGTSYPGTALPTKLGPALAGTEANEDNEGEGQGVRNLDQEAAQDGRPEPAREVARAPLRHSTPTKAEGGNAGNRRHSAAGVVVDPSMVILMRGLRIKAGGERRGAERGAHAGWLSLASRCSRSAATACARRPQSIWAP
jgi:hypothetical protein